MPHPSLSPPLFATARAPFIAAGYPANTLLPLIPPGAKLAPGCTLDAGALGKIPGRYAGRVDGVDAWWGMTGDWSKQGLAGARGRLTPAQTQTWPTSQVGISGRVVPAIDVDVDDADAACIVRSTIAAVLGHDPKRRGRAASPRFLVPFRPEEGAVALSGWWRKKEVWNTAVDLKVGLVEFKASGHWVAAGVNPKGDDYVWPDGIPAPGELPVVSQELLARLLAAMEAELLAEGYELRLPRYSRLDAPSSHRADTVRQAQLPQLVTEEQLEAFLRAIPCEPATIGGHEEAFKAYAAIASVLGEAYQADAPPGCVVEFACGYGDTDVESAWLHTRWSSLADGVRQGPAGFRAWARQMAAAVGTEEAAAAAKLIDSQIARAIALTEFDVVELEPGEEEAAPPPTPAEAYAAQLELMVARWVYVAPHQEWRYLSHKAAQPYTHSALSDSLPGLHLTELKYQADLEVYRERLARQEQVPTAEKPKRVMAHKLLVKEALHAHGLTYAPGDPRLVHTGGRGQVLNLWFDAPRPFKGEVITDEQIEPYLAALAHTLPNLAERTLLLDWMSYVLQHPREKIQWAPVLFSARQGTGKDTVMLPLQFGVGDGGLDSNWSPIDASHLAGTHNTYLQARVIYLKEIPTRRKRDLMGDMKAQVAGTAGGSVINPKYVPPYTIPDRACWVCTTNHPDALDLTEDDRRFAILACAEIRLPQELSRAVYAFYAREGDKQGLLQVAEWLRQRTISPSFSSSSPPATSEAKTDMRLLSLDGTGGEELMEMLDPDDGAWRDRSVLWAQEVDRVVDGHGRTAKRATRREHVLLAMDLAGWERHPSACPKGRISTVLGGRNVRAFVWVRRGTEAVAEKPAQVLRRLYEEMKETSDGVAAGFLEARPTLFD